MASEATPYEVAVKGRPAGGAKESYDGELLDCPFCQRVLLTLEEKKVPYKKLLIDLDNKPAWLMDASPNGNVPAMKLPERGGAWLPDSGDIVDYLEEAYPEPALGKSGDATGVGQGILPGLVKLLKSLGGEEEGAMREALVAELRLLERHLAGEDGPGADGRPGPRSYLSGDALTGEDLALIPKIRHVQVAGSALGGLPEAASGSGGFPLVEAYVERVRARPSWVPVEFPDTAIIAGWERHLRQWGILKD